MVAACHPAELSDILLEVDSWIPWCRGNTVTQADTASGSVARPELYKQLIEQVAGLLKGSPSWEEAGHPEGAVF